MRLHNGMNITHVLAMLDAIIQFIEKTDDKEQIIQKLNEMKTNLSNTYYSL